MAGTPTFRLLNWDKLVIYSDCDVVSSSTSPLVENWNSEGVYLEWWQEVYLFYLGGLTVGAALQFGVRHIHTEFSDLLAWWPLQIILAYKTVVLYRSFHRSLLRRMIVRLCKSWGFHGLYLFSIDCSYQCSNLFNLVFFSWQPWAVWM